MICIMGIILPLKGPKPINPKPQTSHLAARKVKPEVCLARQNLLIDAHWVLRWSWVWGLKVSGFQGLALRMQQSRWTDQAHPCCFVVGIGVCKGSFGL